ncbi:site-specific integrase [Rhizobacter sp. Root1221]|uniref:site-specific integrase n=1 Tax=Rhizobacter sp. Root1221 TaxID=1736433 RepID=UPI0006FAEFE3|nr:site-specific integrase [Rhizobacter sp. Root1221]KQW02794.1 hypothetical protein ASC87_00075 [Rhizobacter sp. Root1221]
MAYIRKQRGKWRAEVERKGVRKSKIFETKAAATAWAAVEEAEIITTDGARFPPKTLADTLDRYAQEASPRKKTEAAEIKRIARIKRDFPDLVALLVSEVRTPDLVAWRDKMLKTVSPGGVRREANMLRNVFTVARDEWHWCGESPFKGFKVPDDNPARTRRVNPSEVKLICRWLGYRTGVVDGKQQQVALAFLIGLRTGMRLGEILSLTDDRVDLVKRVARVPHKTQHITGQLRSVPLTRAGARLLKARAGRGAFFDVTAASLDALFRKCTKRLLIDDLHFHDSRAEALTRLARRVDVMTLARISGHKDLQMLLNVYYRESSEDIAARI